MSEVKIKEKEVSKQINLKDYIWGEIGEDLTRYVLQQVCESIKERRDIYAEVERIIVKNISNEQFKGVREIIGKEFAILRDFHWNSKGNLVYVPEKIEDNQIGRWILKLINKKIKDIREQLKIDYESD